MQLGILARRNCPSSSPNTDTKSSPHSHFHFNSTPKSTWQTYQPQRTYQPHHNKPTQSPPKNFLTLHHSPPPPTALPNDAWCPSILKNGHSHGPSGQAKIRLPRYIQPWYSPLTSQTVPSIPPSLSPLKARACVDLLSLICMYGSLSNSSSMQCREVAHARRLLVTLHLRR